MNSYILIYFGLHGFIVIILLLNVLFQLLRMTQIKIVFTKNVQSANGTIAKDVWNQDRNYTRAKNFVTQSSLALLVAVVGEGLSFWLLWMADAF